VSDQNALVQGDVPPGSFGQTAMNLRGSEEPAYISFPALTDSAAATNGIWHIRFWTKSAAGNPAMAVAPQGLADPVRISPAGEWRQHDLRFTVQRDPEPRSVTAHFEVTGGDALIDDVAVWQEGDTNPTAFRDDLVDLLKEHSPGVMRLMSNNGNTLENAIRPRLQAYTSRAVTYGKIKRNEIGIHEFYDLCAHVGSAAWATLPGQMTRQEMDQYMEYIGAPADVGLGKLRAELGQEEPWTEALSTIYVQIGNEVITFPGTGYNGPDYWNDLIGRAKASPYYRPNVLLVVDHQGGPRNILPRNPSADVLSVGNYIIMSLTQQELDNYLTDTDKLFRYVFSRPYKRWMLEEPHDYHAAVTAAKDHGVQMAVYEGGNYHITFGDAPPEERNKIVTSIGGQVSAVNSMLMIMKEHRIRAQNQFNLAQFGFVGGGSFGSGVAVRLWGQVTNMRPDKRRYRPGFLAAKMANEVIGGDVVETRHDGDVPRFSATGMYDKKRKSGKFTGEVRTIEDIPILYSYAFKDGARRALILVSLDTSEPREVAIEFLGKVAADEARRWILTADAITANNEPEVGESQVVLCEDRVSGFGSGQRLAVPPFSMVALEWYVE
jgi:alpha-L-arabinofuranosidase